MSLLLLILSALLALCALIVLSVVLNHRKRMRVWNTVAQKYGMRLSGALYPLKYSFLEGRFEGRPCIVHTEFRGNYGRRFSLSHEVCLVKVSLPELLPPPFSLVPASLFDKLASRLGAGDGELGDKEFDDAFTLTNLDPTTAEILRDSEVRRQCFRLTREASRDFRIQEGAVQMRRGIFMREEDFEPLVRPVLEFCRVLDLAAARRIQGPVPVSNPRA